MQLKFQLAEKADLEEIIQLYKNAIVKMDEQNIPQWDEVYPDSTILEDDVKKNQMFIGKKNDKIAVCFVLNEECDEEYKNGKWICPDSRFCVIHRLCVSPDFQNQGIAGETMKHIEEVCRAQKYDSIRLDCFTKNPYSRRLYDKCGYTVTGYAVCKTSIPSGVISFPFVIRNVDRYEMPLPSRDVHIRLHLVLSLLLGCLYLSVILFPKSLKGRQAYVPNLCDTTGEWLRVCSLCQFGTSRPDVYPATFNITAESPYFVPLFGCSAAGHE